ncbi:glycosyltransferase family 39 protein [Streptomyces scopuliridis]
MRPGATKGWQPPRHALAWAPFLLALALGLWGIRREGTVWQDEAITYEVARRSFPEIWQTLANIDAVHGFYYLIMHIFYMFGDGLLTLRLPSVMATAVAACGVALMGNKLAGPRVGILAGLVFPILPMVQRYAQEGRSYAMVCASVVWATYFLVLAVERPARNIWCGYALTSLVACLFHEFAILAVVAHGVTLFLAHVSRRILAAWVRTALFVSVAITPLLTLSVLQSDQVSWISPTRWGNLTAPLVLSAVAVCCARIPVEHRTTIASWQLALPLLILPAATLQAISFFKPLYVDRYVLFSQLGVALLLGVVLNWVWSVRELRWGAGVITVTACAVTIMSTGVDLRKPGSRSDNATEVVKAAAELGRNGDGIVFIPASRRAWTLGPGSLEQNFSDVTLSGNLQTSDTLYGKEVAPGEIRNRMLSEERIVVLREPHREEAEETTQEKAKRATLNRYFVECGSRTVGRAEVAIYARSGNC